MSRGTRKLKFYAAPETEIVRGTRNWNCHTAPEIEIVTRHLKLKLSRGTRNWNCTRHRKLKLYAAPEIEIVRGTKNWNCKRHQKLKMSRGTRLKFYAAPETEIVCGTRNWNCHAAPEIEIVTRHLKLKLSRGTRNWNCTRHLGIFSMSASVMGWRHSSSSTSAASRLFILLQRKNRIEIRVPDPEPSGSAMISLSRIWIQCRTYYYLLKRSFTFPLLKIVIIPNVLAINQSAIPIKISVKQKHIHLQDSFSMDCNLLCIFYSMTHVVENNTKQAETKTENLSKFVLLYCTKEMDLYKRSLWAKEKEMKSTCCSWTPGWTLEAAGWRGSPQGGPPHPGPPPPLHTAENRYRLGQCCGSGSGTAWNRHLAVPDL